MLFVVRRPGAVLRPRGGCSPPSPAVLVVTSAATGMDRFDVVAAATATPPTAPCCQAVHGLLRARRRRLVGRRSRRQPGEVELAARGAQRLHLRDHRRGARAARHARHPRAVRAARLGLLPARAALAATSSSGSPRPASRRGSLVQAIVNIGAVLGLLPVIGVPLPLVSSGGSVAVTTLSRSACCSPSRGTNRARVQALRRARPGPSSRRSLAVLPAPARTALMRARATRPSSVLLAGGGTAGHVVPLLALADALRRRDPDVGMTALGTETGLETRLVPARGYDAAHRAAGAAAAQPDRRPAAAAGALRGAVAAAERGHRRDRGRRRRRLRRLRRRRPPTSRPAGAASRSSSTRRTPAPGSPTGSVPG